MKDPSIERAKKTMTTKVVKGSRNSNISKIYSSKAGPIRANNSYTASYPKTKSSIISKKNMKFAMTKSLYPKGQHKRGGSGSAK